MRPHDRLEGAPERRDVTFTNGDFEIRVENTSAVENLSRVFYKIFVFLSSMQCDKIWRYFATFYVFEQFLKPSISIWQNFQPTLANIYAMGPIYTV